MPSDPIPFESPVIEQLWNGSHTPLAFTIDRLYPDSPTVGLVIGTYAAVPFIHLQLEAHRRLYPHVPVLVHDDCSHHRAELQQLCGSYGCDFESNSVRLPPTLGDLSVFVGGLKWAESRALDLLLKVSRRWIFTIDWTGSLIQLALESQQATFSSFTETYDFGFRTECVGLSVREWSGSRFYRAASDVIRTSCPIFMEGYMHALARTLSHGLSLHARNWVFEHPMPDGREGYAQWGLMGTDRLIPPEPANYLWHDSHPPAAYAKLAQEWGLPYTEADFVDPNQGGGII